MKWLLRGSASQKLLPDGLLALPLVPVPVLGLHVSSGLDPAVLAGALLPMQWVMIQEPLADGKGQGQRKVDNCENVHVTPQQHFHLKHRL